MKEFCVISHTHWDREWYLPLESMKLRLCDLMDRCIGIMQQNSEYIFHLDAQTVVLEDYLAFRPSKKDILKQLISEGRLIIGPWYLQNDFYLTSGEATVRNLLEGRRTAEEFGKCENVGYAPDQFGTISQLPQILKSFNIDSFIFARGFSMEFPDKTPTPSEILWEGADGTQLLAVYMRRWYNNAQHFSPDIKKSLILVEINKQHFERTATTPYILLMNGVDHTEAQGDLLPILKELNSRLSDGDTIRQCSMREYIDNVRGYIENNKIQLYKHTGEFRQTMNVDALKGTLSSRYYLKSANVKAQTMLENRLEPLYSMLELAGARGAYSVDHFRYMWKQLMLNHPHDSICGCSRDEVHEHMEDNYKRLKTTALDLLSRGMQCAAAHLEIKGKTPKNYILTLANTTQQVLSGVVEAIIDIPKSDEVAGIDITDGSGRPANFIVISKNDAVRDAFSPLNLPGNFPVNRYKILLHASEIEPFAIKGYIVNGRNTENKIEPTVSRAGSVLENDAYKITVSGSGQVDLFIKNENRILQNIFELEDTGDRGDSYLYYPDNAAPIYGSEFPAVVETVQSNRLLQEIRITRNLEIPIHFDFEQKCRSQETAVTTVELLIRLAAGISYPEILFTVNNCSRDHRLRLLVNTDIETECSISDCPFDVLSRTDSDFDNAIGGRVLPNSSFAALEANDKGLAVLTEGAHAYEHLPQRKALAFTLVRSTGVIYRNKETLEQIGGDQWLAPENQCLRKINGRFALAPYSGDVLSSNIPVKSVQFRAGLTSFFISCDETRFMKGRPAVQDTRLEEYFFYPDPYSQTIIPDNKSLITVEGDSILVTALKKAEDENGLILRAVNLSSESKVISLNAPGNIYLTDLAESANDTYVRCHLIQEMDGKKINSYRII